MKKLALVVTLGLLSFSSFAYADDKEDDKDDSDRLYSIIETLQFQVDDLAFRLTTLENKKAVVAVAPSRPTVATNVVIPQQPAPIAVPVLANTTSIMANGISLGNFVSVDPSGNFVGVDNNGVSFTIDSNGNYINNTYRVGFVTVDCTIETYFMPTGNFPNGTKVRFQDIAGNEYNSVGNGTFTFTRSEYDQFGNCVQTLPKVMQNAQRAKRALPITIVPPVTIQ